MSLWWPVTRREYAHTHAAVKSGWSSVSHQSCRLSFPGAGTLIVSSLLPVLSRIGTPTTHRRTSGDLTDPPQSLSQTRCTYQRTGKRKTGRGSCVSRLARRTDIWASKAPIQRLTISSVVEKYTYPLFIRSTEAGSIVTTFYHVDRSGKLDPGNMLGVDWSWQLADEPKKR